MCLIIHKPTADTAIPEFILNNAERINPDGFGIVYTDTNECVRTMDYETARELISAKRPFVAHYRYATRGAVNKPNCHPYIIHSSPEQTNSTGIVRLFSNGTVADLGDEKLCDTKVVAQMLKRIPTEHWNDLLSMTDTRFAICSKYGVERHGEWHEKDGIYYSKNNCFHTTYKKTIGYSYQNNYYDNTGYDKYWYDEDIVEKTDLEEELATVQNTNKSSRLNVPEYDWQNVSLVAVYGTLKAGHGNHKTLGSSFFIGAGKTVYKYPMQVSTIPFVYEKAGKGDHVSVEVYNVTNDVTKDDCDWLEGHPTNYQRKLTDIQMHDGAVKTCWLYFANPAFYEETMETIHTY